jgi:hypothetical protein
MGVAQQAAPVLSRRISLRPEQVKPDAGWWARLLCRLFRHAMEPFEETTFVYDPATGRLVGMICPRCGGLNG